MQAYKVCALLAEQKHPHTLPLDCRPATNLNVDAEVVNKILHQYSLSSVSIMTYLSRAIAVGFERRAGHIRRGLVADFDWHDTMPVYAPRHEFQRVISFRAWKPEAGKYGGCSEPGASDGI